MVLASAERRAFEWAGPLRYSDEAMSIRKRVWGPESKKRKAWVLDYTDQAGKRRHKTFKRKRDAEAFAETTRVLSEGSAFVDDAKLDFTIHQERYQERLYGRTIEPLTVRAIIHLIGKIWRTPTTLTDAEQAFLAEFASADDRGSFIENSFLDAAVEGGKTLKAYTHRNADKDEDTDRFGLYRFFGIYVVSWTEYGEGGDVYGPFEKKKDAEAAFAAAVALHT
jgi:hypothetical protein